jgi:hypothetical protein
LSVCPFDKRKLAASDSELRLHTESPLTQGLSELSSLLKDALVTFRPRFVEGISEYELINALQAPPYSLFDKDALRESLVLFQTHFVLFHCLYQLRSEWRTQNVGELHIAATSIKLTPYVKSGADMQTADPLCEYYLDWSNLSTTDESDVEALLESFWQKMAGGDAGAQISELMLHEACMIMQIDSIDTTDVSQLKQQYRTLQHKNHPDKGGSIEASQSILQAYTRLRRYLTT